MKLNENFSHCEKTFLAHFVQLKYFKLIWPAFSFSKFALPKIGLLVFTGTKRLAVCLVMRKEYRFIVQILMENYVLGSLCELLDINS